MRRMLRHALLACTVLGLVLAAGGTGRAADPKTFKYSDNGYAILDPAHVSIYRLNDERLLVALQECLTVLDPETGKAKPAAASRWDASADRKTWTFHLRQDAKWSDGSDLTAHDFVRSWQRTMDPFTRSEWTPLFRPIKGCATISDNSARTQGYSDLRNGLKELKKAHPNGIPGDVLNLLLDDTGVRPFLRAVKGRSVKSMIKWKEGDLFPPEMVTKVIEALKKERRRVKRLWSDAFDEFGKPGTGVHAKDEHTLVVTTEGDVHYLPELLARAAFAPLHKGIDEHRDKVFEVNNFVSSGPFLLAGRGAKPPESEPDKRVLSVVHLKRNPTYNGPAPAHVDEILCYTDQRQGEDLRQYEKGTLQWVNATWPEFPQKKKRPEVESLKGFTVRDTPRVLVLRFRCDRAPFRSKDARQAFALAMDRGKLAERFWPKAEPAFRIVPPGIDGRVEGFGCPKPNASSAKAAFKAAGLDDDTWIEFSYGEAPGQDDAADTLIRGWKKNLGVEPGKRIESELDVRNILRSGKYYVMLSAMRGSVNDPYAYLAPFHSGDADSGLGWRDAAFDALIDAARDPDTALADPEGWLAKVGLPQLGGALAAAKAGQQGRVRLRQEALAAAEKRLMDEYVVVPLLFMREAVLLGGATGLGSPEARKNPGFVGSLRTVKR